MASARQRGKTWTAYWRLPDGSQKTKGGFPTEKAAMEHGRHAEALANPPEPWQRASAGDWAAYAAEVSRRHQ